jgi:hypothetical protein
VKLQISDQTLPVKNKLSATHNIYNTYAGMLLGYLTDIVKDRQLAENYLVEVFNELPDYLTDYYSAERSVWVQLQALAKSKLTSFFESKTDCKVVEEEAFHSPASRVGYRLNKLSTLQRNVFCGLYYHNKPVNALARELKQSEESIKRLLKEAFSIIKNDK